MCSLKYPILGICYGSPSTLINQGIKHRKQTQSCHTHTGEKEHSNHLVTHSGLILHATALFRLRNSFSMNLHFHRCNWLYILYVNNLS